MARNESGNDRRAKGVSLAKGPVGIVGLIGVIYGLSALIFASHGFALHIPHGAAHGKRWIGLEVNGWSGLLFIAAGLALFLSAPLHWAAKGMSLLVGLVMIAAAIVAAIRGNGVFGIFAANHLTELIWAAAGVMLLVLALLPRVGSGRGCRDGDEPAQPEKRMSATQKEPLGSPEPQQPLIVTRDADAQQRGVPDAPESARTVGARKANTDTSH